MFVTKSKIFRRNENGFIDKGSSGVTKIIPYSQ